MHNRFKTRQLILAYAFVACHFPDCLAEERLHQRIDRLVAAKLDGPPAPRSSDGEFFRRIHLDLAGVIPTGDDTRRFLIDRSPDRRRTVIDRLLDAPSYVERMTNLFHVILIERRGDDPEWNAFLRGCFAENKPWDRIVREILRPNRDNDTVRGAAFFYTSRLKKVGQNPTDHPGLTRDVGRLFLGIDLQCAQCHNHLFVDDYEQREFQGLFAVYRNLSIRREKFPAVNEAAMTRKLDFVSVFGSDAISTGPRIPFGREFEIPEPPPPDPARKRKKPNPDDPPTFSALSLVAEELPSPDNRLFRQNIANRLWFVMMGRGLVEPLDQFHSGNPPTHPELLDLLADELAAQEFDLKWMLRELALTRTWQRSSRMASDEDVPSDDSYRLGRQRRLTAEQLFRSTLQATGNLERLAPPAGAEVGEEFEEIKARFVEAFAGEPKEPALRHTPAVKQALFLLNDRKLLDLLKPQSGNLVARLLDMPDERVAEELFVSIFGRLPDDAERASIEDHLKQNRSDRVDALRRLAWAMLTSMEFCVNH